MSTMAITGLRPVEKSVDKLNKELTSVIMGMFPFAFRVRRLLQAGADPNHTVGLGSLSRIYHLSMLHIASRLGLHQIVKILLDAKANPNATDEAGRTPLHYAIKKDNKRIINLLLNHSDVNQKDKRGWNVLQYATFTKVEESVIKLLKETLLKTKEKDTTIPSEETPEGIETKNNDLSDDKNKGEKYPQRITKKITGYSFNHEVFDDSDKLYEIRFTLVDGGLMARIIPEADSPSWEWEYMNIKELPPKEDEADKTKHYFVENKDKTIKFYLDVVFENEPGESGKMRRVKNFYVREELSSSELIEKEKELKVPLEENTIEEEIIIEKVNFQKLELENKNPLAKKTLINCS